MMNMCAAGHPSFAGVTFCEKCGMPLDVEPPDGSC